MKTSDPVFVFSILVLVLIFLLAALLMGVVVWGGSSATSDARREMMRMAFAAAVVAATGLAFMEGMAMYFWSSTPEQRDVGKKIFEACRTILPPIATLILGYYFGASGSAKDPKSTGESAD